MLFAAEFGVGQVLWSIFWFFLFFLWIWLVISLFSDIMTSDDLSGPMKAIWAIGIIIFPFIGIFLYLIVRGGNMGERALGRAKKNEEAFQSYVRDVSGGGSVADELEKLTALKANGTISDADFEAAKAKLLG